MEFFNTNADESKNAAALQEYANSLALGKDKEAKEDAKVDDYNEKLQSVLEPIGAKLVEEPARELVKGTVKGVARRITKKGEEVVKTGIQKAADRLGVKPGDLVKLRSRVTEGVRTLGKGAGDIPKTARLRVEPTPESRARLLKLKAKLRNSVRVQSADKPVEVSGFGVEDDSIADLAKAPITREQGLLDQLAPMRAQIQATKALRDFRATADIPPEQLLEAKPAPPLAKPDIQLEQGEERAVGGLEEGAEGEAGDVGKSIAKQATKKAVKTGLKEAAETAGTEFAEIEAAGGGPEDIVSTVIGGVVGLGTLLAGVFGGKHHQEPTTMPINPSTNYGI
jgi:hypothetical protein